MLSDLVFLLGALGALILFAVAAVRWGADSRDLDTFVQYRRNF